MGAVGADPFALAAAMAALAARLALACVFLAAALHAWADLDDYAGVVQAYRILPERVARLAAWLLPPVEAAVAVLLLLPFTAQAASLAGFALVAGFTASIVLNLLRGADKISCGCGGGSQPISWALVWRNIALLAVLALCASVPGRLLPDPAAWVGVAGMGGFLSLLYFGANQLLANAQALAPALAPIRARRR
jgi:uncharacterized membrane protein YphA (DoxX/SURF4 family)